MSKELSQTNVQTLINFSDMVLVTKDTVQLHSFSHATDDFYAHSYALHAPCLQLHDLGVYTDCSGLGSDDCIL